MKKCFRVLTPLAFLLMMLMMLALSFSGCVPVQPDNRQHSPDSETFNPIETCPAGHHSTLLVGEALIQDETTPPETTFQILITFDEEIILMDSDPVDWSVPVIRRIRYTSSDESIQEYSRSLEENPAFATVLHILQIDAQSILLNCFFEETPFAGECVPLFSVVDLNNETLDGSYAATFHGSLGLQSGGPFQSTTIEGTYTGRLDCEMNGILCGTFTGKIDHQSYDGLFCREVRGTVQGDYEGVLEGRVLYGDLNGYLEGVASGPFSGTISTFLETVCPVPYPGLITGQTNLAGYFAAAYGQHPDWPDFEPTIALPWEQVPDDTESGDRVLWAYTGEEPPVYNVYGLSCYQPGALSGEAQ